MVDESKINNYLIYGAIVLLIILILVVCGISIEYYKRKVKRLKLELYRETKLKENQLNSKNGSVATTNYNYPSFMTTQTSIKKGSYIDNYNYDDDDEITSYSNCTSNKKDKMSFISEGVGDIQEKSRDKYQSLYSVNTTIHSAHSTKPSYSYYPLAGSQEFSQVNQDPNSYQINHNRDSQNALSLYRNSNSNVLFYDEISNNNANLNSQADTITTISTTTTITTNTNMNSTYAMALTPNSSNVRNYLSHPQPLTKSHDKLRINTSNLKPISPIHSGFKTSPNISYTQNTNNTTNSKPSSTPKHRLLNFPNNSSFIQNKSNNIDTKPISTTMIATSTIAVTQTSSYGHYSIDDSVVDNKRISLIQSQEKYSQSPRNTSPRTSLIIDPSAEIEYQSLSNNDNKNDLAKKKAKNRRSYTEQLRPVLTNISLDDLKEANNARSHSAKLSSDKIKVIKVKKHLSYTEQLTPVLSDKRNSVLSEHRLSSIDKSKYRHSTQSIQSIHNVVDEELVSPRPISLISNQRLSFMTSEMEEQLNHLTSSESSQDNIELPTEIVNDDSKKEKIGVENENENENKNENENENENKNENKNEMLKMDELNSTTTSNNPSCNMDNEFKLKENNKKPSTALDRVSLLIGRLENSASLISKSPLNLKTENNNVKTDNLKLNTQHFSSSPILDENNDSNINNVNDAINTVYNEGINKKISFSNKENNKNEDSKKSVERSSRYYSKQRLSLISNYSEVSEHNNNSNNSYGGGKILNLFKKSSKSTVNTSTSPNSHSPNSYQKRSISPLSVKNSNSFIRSPLDTTTSPLKNNKREEEEDDDDDIKMKGRINTSFANTSLLVEEGEGCVDDRKDLILNEENESNKNALSVSSSSLSRSIYMDIRKDGSSIRSTNDSEHDTDNFNSKRKPNLSDLYNFFEVRHSKNKQRKGHSSGSSSNHHHKEAMKFEEVSESESNHLSRNYSHYDSDSFTTDRTSHGSKKHSLISNYSNFNSNFDYNTSFSISQKYLKGGEGNKDRIQKEKDKFYNSSSVYSNVSGPIVKSTAQSLYSNHSIGDNSQYQNENLNLKFINNSTNGSVNFNNDSFDTNDDYDIISNSYGVDAGDRQEKAHNFNVNEINEHRFIDRRSIYSTSQPVKPPKSQRRQLYSPTSNSPNRLTPTLRDDDIHSNSSASLNFAEIQKYQNASMPMSLDKYKNYYYQNSFSSPQNSGHDENVKEISENQDVNTSFSSKSQSLLAHSISDHSSQVNTSFQSINPPSLGKPVLNNPTGNTYVNTNTNATINANTMGNTYNNINNNDNYDNNSDNGYNHEINDNDNNDNDHSNNDNDDNNYNIINTSGMKTPSISSKLGLNDQGTNDLDSNKINMKKSTPELWKTPSFKSSTSVISYSSSNYSSDLKDNETEKLPQRVKDSVPKRSQYSSQNEHKRSSSTHRKRKQSGSAHHNLRNKEKGIVDDIETEGSLSLTLYSPSQNLKPNENKSPIAATSSSQVLTQNTDMSESNTISPLLQKKKKKDDDQDNFGNHNMNITVNHLILDMNINNDIKGFRNYSPESLDSAKTLNNSQISNNMNKNDFVKNRGKEQENKSLKSSSPFSNVNSQFVIEEKGEAKDPSLHSKYSYSSNESTVPLLRDIISDSLLQMQSKKLQPIRGKVHILTDPSSPNVSPNVSPVASPVQSLRFISTTSNDYSQRSTNSVSTLCQTDSIPERKFIKINKDDIQDKGKEKLEDNENENQDKDANNSENDSGNDNNEDKENIIVTTSSYQTIPSFIFTEKSEDENEDNSNSIKPIQPQPIRPQFTALSQESDSNISVGSNSISKTKKKYDVLYNNNNISPLLKPYSNKRKYFGSGVTSPMYSKNNLLSSQNLSRKSSPLSFTNSNMVRNNYSPLSKIEEDGNMEQNFIVSSSSYIHIPMEGNEGNNDLSIGTDTSRTSESTITEYKNNIPNATDQSALSTSSDNEFDDEEIFSVDINLISQDDASTYNSPYLFPIVTPPNYEQLFKDQSYKL